MDILEAIQKIIHHYTYDQQKDIAIEEMAELTQAIIKKERYKGTDRELEFNYKYCEELADVWIMVEQMRNYLTDKEREEFNNQVEYKLKRQMERIENVYKNK